MKTAKEMKKPADIVLYRSEDGVVKIDVQLEEDTVWLNREQLSVLFGRDRTVVSRHINNIFKEGELQKKLVCANFAHTTPHGAIEGKTQSQVVEYYNLDVIISVGYRVKSKQGTQFRIWATDVLKQHLVKGYSVNAKRLKALNQTLRLAADISKRKLLSGDEATALLQTVSEYSYALDLLDDYDHQRVAVRKVSRRKAKGVTYEEAMKLIDQMRIKFGDSAVFGKEKDKSLHSSLNAIMQSFDGKDLYPSVEEKSAHLLYFLVKNHSFVDGNKRIAAALFLRFAEKNKLVYDKEGHKRVADNALVAMTLMIAESKPKEKAVITAMLTNLIVGGGE
jgi:prophage maintenance system killer protein